MPKSFAELRLHVNMVGKAKGAVEAKKAGLAYCDAWKEEIEVIKVDLGLLQGRVSPDDYNKKVRELNKNISDMNSSIKALNKMIK